MNSKAFSGVVIFGTLAVIFAGCVVQNRPADSTPAATAEPAPVATPAATTTTDPAATATATATATAAPAATVPGKVLSQPKAAAPADAGTAP
jgi:hypothetical protein